jgi:hypothetical protein
MIKRELELFEELYEATRSLLRYDGIDSEKVCKALDNMDTIVVELRYIRENKEH